MENILFVNHNIERCGIYQYGKRVFDISKKSKSYNFEYVEVTSPDDLFLAVKNKNPKIIVYNYVPDTLPWFNNFIFETIKNSGIQQGNIVHNCQYGNFDFYLHQDPYYKNNQKNYALLRPLFEYIPSDNINSKEDNTIKIGTFGFGGQHKFVPEICRLVSEEFGNSEYKVELNLHITEGFYSGNFFEEIKKESLNNSNYKNISLNMTSDFLSNQSLMDFLYNNDLNIFFYENYSFYNGISSSVDYGLSVKKPMAICKSNMFSHIMDTNPSICVEDTDLIDIIKNGFTPLQQKCDSWSHENFIHNIEMIVRDLL